MEKILTFREWKENFVTVHFELEDKVTIKSRINNSILFSTIKPSAISKIKENQDKKLLEIYQENFDIIQFNYNQLLKEFDNYGVQSN